MTRRLLGLLIAVLIIVGSAWWRSEGRERIAGAAQWSETRPPINITHIFAGDINQQGRPVGFHSRPGGKDPFSARVIRIDNQPNAVGIYDAQVEIRHPATGQWLRKRSTFFPDAMDRQAVIAAILYAYHHRTTGNGTKFRGPSGYGFTIEGYRLRDGAINTAYPIRQ